MRRGEFPRPGCRVSREYQQHLDRLRADGLVTGRPRNRLGECLGTLLVVAWVALVLLAITCTIGGW